MAESDGRLGILLAKFDKITRDFKRNEEIAHAFIVIARDEAAVTWSELLGPLGDEYVLSVELANSDGSVISPYAVGQMALRHIQNLDPYSLALATLLRHSAWSRHPEGSFGQWLFKFHQMKAEQKLTAQRVAMAANGIQLEPSPLLQSQCFAPDLAAAHARRQSIIDSLVGIPS